MSKRMSEWEVQQVANNLDRINDYRMSKGTDMMYTDPSILSEHISEYDAQQIANNLDRINDYRMENMSLDQTILVIKLCLIFFAIIIGGVLYLNAPDIFYSILAVVVPLVVGLTIRVRRRNTK